MFQIFSVKKGIVHLRASVKIIILIAISMLLAAGAILFFYKPTYMVSYNGEFIGYVSSKSMLQSKINEFIKVGNGSTNNVAFVQIEKMPEYKLCLLKKDMETNDNEIYDKIVNTGIYYYKYYTILLNGEEKYSLATYDEAQSVITKLKEKDSNNIAKITVGERYNTSLVEFASVDTCVENLYEKKVVYVPPVRKASGGNSGSIGSSRNVNRGGGASLGGLTLIRPVGGKISCRYGQQRGYYHTGLDIATANGTPIVAAADGVVSYAAYHYSYGNLLIVNHANGVQTYYAHCSRLNVSVGQSVSQGQTIAAVGSTGNSTGPHLHLEVRVNGTAQNPQNYVY